jgi:hypothetical protein
MLKNKVEPLSLSLAIAIRRHNEHEVTRAIIGTVRSV